MQEWFVQMIEQYGYWGILVLIAVENIFPPIPSEVILTFGGFMTTYSDIHVVGVILSATAGSMLGAYVLYGIGRLLSPEHLKKILDGKLGRLLHLKSEDVFKANDWFLKKGTKAVFFCRCIPVIRSLISIPAGMSKMNLWKFTVFTVFGSLVWNTVLSLLGMVAGASWEKILVYMDVYSLVAAGILFVLVVIFVIWFYRKRLRKKQDINE